MDDIQKEAKNTQDFYGFDRVEILGARTHNLKNIDVSFPRNQLVVLTGVSGSGKSSLAFDTLYTEGQRRYRESFSSYARTFLGSVARPEVDQIRGLSPVIAIEQKTITRNARSTVGTATEIYDFMRLLFARIADGRSDANGTNLSGQNETQMVERILRDFAGECVTILVPLVRGRKGQYRNVFEKLDRMGFAKVKIDGTIVDLEDVPTLERNKKHDLDLVVDHFLVGPQKAERLKNALRVALEQGAGTAIVLDAHQNEHRFSTHPAGACADKTGAAPEPNLFSFNTPYGACPTCDGLGEIAKIDPASLIPNPTIGIQDGAIPALGTYKETLIFKKIAAILKFYRHSLATPVAALPQKVVHLLLFGNTGKHAADCVAPFPEPFEGVVAALIKQNEKESLHNRPSETAFEYMAACPDCAGARLNKRALAFHIQGKNIADLSAMHLFALKEWFALLPNLLSPKRQTIAHEILKEIDKRLIFLIDVGLHYLQLNRSLHSLSGGEAQRIRLATQIGTQLLGVLYILDEPSIGLHQRDNARLIASLKALRDIGNTVLVVEHDEEIMLEADYLIEIGPKAGIHGGSVVAAGSLPDFLAQPSVTADFLTHKKAFPMPSRRRTGNGHWITVRGCTGNNLKKATLAFPLGCMVCVTGVSGSGKSTLVHKTLMPILKKKLCHGCTVPLPYEAATGLEHINKIIEVSQMPIGRTPRSNPSTYTGMFTDIRVFFALLPEAKIRGYKPSRFSFNLKEGRCMTCEGMGLQRIEMGFLPEVCIPCETCGGKRYNRETLDVQYKGKSIADVLEMTIADALEFFAAHPSIHAKLLTLSQVGLGYVTLGQHATTLSGGEAQRIKLASELSKKSTGDTLYVLDEPSTGLHFQDVTELLQVLNTLVDQGNTVLVVEHHMDIVKAADYVVDVGPEGGAAGGTIVAAGTPEEVACVPESHTGRFLQKSLAQGPK